MRVRVRPGTATVACTVPTACTFSRGLRSAFGFDKAEVEAGGGKPGKGDAEGGKSGKVRRTPFHPTPPPPPTPPTPSAPARVGPWLRVRAVHQRALPSARLASGVIGRREAWAR